MAPILGILASSFFQPTGDYQAIMTATVDSGGASSITFSSIPSTYKHLQIRSLTRHSQNGTSALLQFNSDTAANYSQHQIYADGGSVGANGTAPSSSIWATYCVNTATVGAGIIDILDYADTNKYKTARILTGSDNNGSGYMDFRSGSWRSTSAINSIQITLDAGTFSQYTQFALFGLKG